MGIEHRHRPIWGVQFHPESIATEYGHRLFENFYAPRSRARQPRSGDGRTMPPLRRRRAAPKAPGADGARKQLETRTIDGAPSTELLFEALFGDAEYAFWLDSADAPSKLGGRSYLGTSAGPHATILHYDVNRHIVAARPRRRYEDRTLLDLRAARARAQHTEATPTRGLRRRADGRLRRLPRI